MTQSGETARLSVFAADRKTPTCVLSGHRGPLNAATSQHLLSTVPPCPPLGKMKLTSHHIQVAQGALFLVDNIGPPPPNTDFRQFTNNAIAQHLQRHSYFYQQRNQPGPENRIPVTSNWMRKYFLSLLGKARPLFYQAESERDDSADKCFRKGTTKGFPDDVLARYEYNRATFSEADLPGYIGDADVTDDDEDAVEMHGATGNDKSTGPRPSKLNPGSSGDRDSFSEQPTEAAHVPSPAVGSHKSFRTTGDAENMKDEDDEEDCTYSDANENFGDQPGLHGRGRTPANSATQDNPASVQEGASEAEEHPVKVQSLEKRGGGLPKNPALHSARTSTAATESILFHPSSTVQGSNALSPPSRARNAIESALSRAKRRNGSDPERDGLEQPANHPPVDIGKRKRSDEDISGSFEDEMAMKPTERKKNKTSIKLGRNVVHPRVIIPRATPPPRASSELSFGASTPLVANATHGVENPNGMQPQVEEVKDSQSSQHAASTQNSEQQPKLAPFDAGEQGQDFENFYIMIERATDRVIKSIGDIGNSVSFLDESPSKRLEALYTRCWGSDWRAVRVRLTKEQVFTTPDAAMSMISAFLFDNVLNQQASIQEIQAKQLELKGTMGRAILRTLNLEGGGE